MKAVRYTGPRQAEIVEIPSRPLQAGEVRVKMARCGICGSDVHRFLDEVLVPVFPITPGHEPAGTVVEVGPGVDTGQYPAAKPGQRVAIFPVASCAVCPACQAGRPNLCPEMRIMGPGMPGAYAEEVVIPPSMLRALPDNVSFDDAALIEPMAVAIHAANRARLLPGGRVAILGMGTIGLLGSQVVKAKGASYVIGTGRQESKLALAGELGCDETVNITKEEVVTPERADSFDVIIDMVCNQSTVEQGMALANMGGRIIFVASPARGSSTVVDLTSPLWISKELTFGRSKIYDTDFDEAIPLLASGQVKAAAIITHRYRLEETPRALAEIIQDRAHVVKAILDIG